MKKRYASLDVLRGITIAFMCIVNNPGFPSASSPICRKNWSNPTRRFWTR